MWKFVSRRIRDSFERSVNHFDKRSSAGVVNSAGNASEQKGKKKSTPPCLWFCSRRCRGQFGDDNDTNSKRWNFDELNRSWIDAISWSGGLVMGWYTSQLIHFKLKYCSQGKNHDTVCKSTLLSTLYPYIKAVNKNPVYLDSVSRIEKVLKKFTPTVHMVSNDHVGAKGSSGSGSDTSASSETSDVLGDVLNSIENKLGLAAIESGHHQDGLNLLKSAANRNHAPAMYNLGLCYEMGLGVPVDEKTAMELYRSAAALEHPGALYNLGVYYGQGRGGLSRNMEMATRLFRLAAVQGQQSAIDALKSLDLPEEPILAHEEQRFEFRCTPFVNNGIPATTTLFVENINYLHNVDNSVY